MRKIINAMLAVAFVAAVVGCQTAKQPGRSNEQNVTVKDDSVLNVDQSVRSSAIALPTIPADGYSTNALAQIKQLVTLQAEMMRSGENQRTYGDVFSLNLMAESRDEAQTSTATSTPSTSVPLNVAWGAGAIGGSGGGSTMDTMYTAFRKWWSSGGATNTTKTTTATTTPAAAGSACSDGSCSVPK